MSKTYQLGKKLLISSTSFSGDGLFYFYWFFENCVQSFDHMHPYAATHPTSPRLPPPSLPTQLCPLPFFFFSFINGNTLREYFFSQQLSVANSSWLGWDFVSTCPLPAGTWCGFSFHGTCHNCYEFICAASLLCPEDSDSLPPFTTSVSRSLRSLPLPMITEAWKEREKIRGST